MATPGSEISILSLLFNMIVYLGIIIFLLHKKEIIYVDYGYIETKIDENIHKNNKNKDDYK